MAVKVNFEIDPELAKSLNTQKLKFAMMGLLHAIDDQVNFTEDVLISCQKSDSQMITFSINSQSLAAGSASFKRDTIAYMFLILKAAITAEIPGITTVDCSVGGRSETIHMNKLMSIVQNEGFTKALNDAFDESQHNQTPATGDLAGFEDKYKNKVPSKHLKDLPQQVKEDIAKMKPNYGKVLKTRFTRKAAVAPVITRQAFLDDLANEAIEDTYAFSSIAEAVNFLTQKYKLSMDEIKYLKKKASEGKVNFVEKKRGQLD